MKTTYILGAGASIAESEYRCYKEGEEAISFPSLRNFFRIAENLENIKTKYLNGRNGEQREWLYLFERLHDYWGIPYSKLKEGSPNIEELLIVLESQPLPLLFVKLKDFITEVFLEIQNKIDISNPVLHDKLLEFIKKDDYIINLNYDLIMDYALKNNGNWEEVNSYNIHFDKYYDGANWIANPQKEIKDSPYIKLHGSLNWLRSTGYYDQRLDSRREHFADYQEKYAGKYYLIPLEYFEKSPNLLNKDGLCIPMDKEEVLFEREVIPPILNKPLHKELLGKAKDEIMNSDRIVIIGYSLPITDYNILHLLQDRRVDNPGNGPLKLIVVDIDETVRDKFEKILNAKAEFYSSFECFLDNF